VQSAEQTCSNCDSANEVLYLLCSASTFSSSSRVWISLIAFLFAADIRFDSNLQNVFYRKSDRLVPAKLWLMTFSLETAYSNRSLKIQLPLHPLGVCVHKLLQVLVLPDDLLLSISVNDPCDRAAAAASNCP
jgi:hypothetical protein